MASESKILPSAVGPVVKNESFTVAYINCKTEKDQQERKDYSSSAARYDVLYPVLTNSDPQKPEVPMIGGSVIRIKIQDGAKFDTSDLGSVPDDTKLSIRNLLSQYSSQIQRLTTSISNSIPAANADGYFEIDQLLEARILINRALEQMPSLSDKWKISEIYRIFLSSITIDKTGDPSITDAKTLQDALNQLNQEETPKRDSRIKKIGEFKFIPVQILESILNNSIKPTMSEYIGLTGVKFGELAAFGEYDTQNASYKDLTEDKLVKIIREFFTQFRSKDIINPISTEEVGYFTAHNGFLYLKLPDLTERNPDGLSDDPLDYDDKDDENTFVLFELLKEISEDTNSYGPITLAAVPSPNPTFVSDGDTDTEDLSISILSDGLGGNTDLEFYLSPILNIDAATKVDGFTKEELGLEFTSLPVVNYNVDIQSVSNNENFYKIFESIKKSANLNLNSILGIDEATENLGVAGRASIIQKVKSYLQKNGYPLGVSLSQSGIKSAQYLLGEMNRPEILIGSRGAKPESKPGNPEYIRFFDSKTPSSKPIMASVNSSIVSEIPTDVWIKLESEVTKVNNQDYINLKIPAGVITDDSDKFKSDNFKFLITNENLQFALYVYSTKTHQIVRMPGSNIIVRAPIVEAKAEDPIVDGDKINIPIRLTNKGKNVPRNTVSKVRIGPANNAIELKPGESKNGILFDLDNLRIIIQDKNKVIQKFGQVTKLRAKFFRTNGQDSDSIILYFGDLKDKPADDSKLVFKNLKLNALRFPGGLIHSVPLLQDGNQANISIKTARGTFANTAIPIYTYLLIKANETNASILAQDFGYEGRDFRLLTIETPSSQAANYYVLHSIVAENNGSNLTVINSKQIDVKFPGSYARDVNISRFHELLSDDIDNLAYYMVTSEEITETSANSFSQDEDGFYNYGLLPFGEKGNPEKPSFVRPPHIVAMVADLPGKSGNSITSNRRAKDIENMGVKDDIFIDINKINATQTPGYEYQIVTSDELDRLSLVFYGAEEPRKRNIYNFKIGTKNIKKSSIYSSIKWNNGRLVANLRNIRKVQDIGWAEVLVSKNDARFQTSYTSKVYDVATIPLKRNEDGSETIIPFDTQYKIASNDNFNIYTNLTPATIKTALIFPDLFVGTSYNQTSILPVTPDNIPNQILDLSSNDYITDRLKSYINFSNPIGLEPSFEIVLGSQDASRVYGVILDNSESSIEQILVIAPDGTSSPLNPQDFINGINSGISKGNDLLNQLKSALEKEDKNSDKYKELEKKIEEGTQDYEAAKVEAEQASQGVSEAIPADNSQPAIDAAANAATDVAAAAGDAVAVVTDLLGKLSVVTDVLSSITNLANQFTSALNGTLPKGVKNDIKKVNFSGIFVSKNAVFNSNSFITNEDQTEYKLFLTTKFNNAAAIQFNQPRIISIKVGEQPEAGSKEEQKKLELSDNNDIQITAIGADKDTKFEISGVRVKATLIDSSGIQKTFRIKVPDISKLATYGVEKCIKIALTNSNKKRQKAITQLGNDIAVTLDDKYGEHITGGGRRKQGRKKDLSNQYRSSPLRLLSNTLDTAAVPKDAIRSFCDFSFHASAELQFQLRTFQVILVPVKVIFCIIDVICALLNPFALVFAIIRLFLCLYDLILLLPQISVPVMALSLVLHLLEAIYCIILTILGIVTAINEVITAIENAIEQQNYASIVALEEVLNEHLLSIEAELSVLDPVFTILGIFLELLQLTFAFPCRVAPLDDNPSCIDPSQLSSLVLSRVAPSGRVEPDNLLPMAQAYTTIRLDDLGSRGNTPDSTNDPNSIAVGDTKPYYGLPFNSYGVVVEPSEMVGAEIARRTTGDTILPGTIDYNTGENKLTSNGSFFADATSGKISNVDYSALRFNGPNLLGTKKIVNGQEISVDTQNNFQATFSLSYTKTTKPFNLLVGQDPRVVNFEFNSKGITSKWAFTFWAFLYRKKAVDINATLDQPPSFLIDDNGVLRISPDNDAPNMVSPIDGASQSIFLSSKVSGNKGLFTPKPLTVTFELQQPVINPITQLAEFLPQTVTRTFANIPMIALMDDQFNTYFVQDDGIVAEKEDGIWKIKKITAKIINQASAPRRSYSIEDKDVFEADLSKYNIDSYLSEAVGGEADGSVVIKQQTNADYVTSLSGITFDPSGKTYNPQDGDGISLTYAEILDISSSNLDFSFTDVDGDSVTMTIPAGSIIAYPYPNYSAVDHSRGNNNQIDALTNAVRIQDVFDFPKLYIVDMRQLADEISSACSSPNELLLDQFDDFVPLAKRLNECLLAYRDFFVGDQVDSSGVPTSIIEKTRYSLALGLVPEPISIQSVVSTHETLQGCLEGVADDICNFVINPLNTSFKILNDTNQTPREDVVNPESQDLVQLINSGLLTQTEVEAALAGFPTITGAMEYASGVGDLAIVTQGQKAYIQVIPRDSYDKIIQESYDLSEKIIIDFVTDETGSASLVPVEEGTDSLVIKSGGSYTFAVSADKPGKVVIRGTVCKVIIQAVTDRGIVNQIDATEGVDCIPNVNPDGTTIEQGFAPGALIKIDRNLTILFEAKKAREDKYGDDDRNQSARSAKSSPQTFGTKLSN